MATVMSLHVGARFPLVATLVTITVFSILFTLCSGQTQGSSDGPASVAPSKPKTPKPNPTTIRQKTVQPQTVVTLVLDPVPDKPKTAKTTSKPVTKPVAITVGPTRKPTSQNDMKPASQNGAKPNDHDDHHGEEELPFCEANERAGEILTNHVKGSLILPTNSKIPQFQPSDVNVPTKMMIFFGFF